MSAFATSHSDVYMEGREGERFENLPGCQTSSVLFLLHDDLLRRTLLILHRWTLIVALLLLWRVALLWVSSSIASDTRIQSAKHRVLRGWYSRCGAFERVAGRRGGSLLGRRRVEHGTSKGGTEHTFAEGTEVVDRNILGLTCWV